MSGQTPLIGSRISLISKKDIRYEGILYTIYAHEHSVVLQNGAWPRARARKGGRGRGRTSARRVRVSTEAETRPGG